MPKHNPANERIKREYFAYLKGPRGRDTATIDGVAKSLVDSRHRPAHAISASFGASKPPALACGWPMIATAAPAGH